MGFFCDGRNSELWYAAAARHKAELLCGADFPLAPRHHRTKSPSTLGHGRNPGSKATSHAVGQHQVAPLVTPYACQLHDFDTTRTYCLLLYDNLHVRFDASDPKMTHDLAKYSQLVRVHECATILVSSINHQDSVVGPSHTGSHSIRRCGVASQ